MSGFTINQTFIQFVKRAERASNEKLVSTFVGIDNLVAALGSQDHRVIFGRRGTGKTHALSYVAEQKRAVGDHPIFIDLRTIGSDQSIYADQSRSISERASRLLVDVLGQIHEKLFVIAIENGEEYDLSVLANYLDKLSEAISLTKVVGDVTVATDETRNNEAKRETSAGIAVNFTKPEARFGAVNFSQATSSSKRSISTTGPIRYSIVFGDIHSSLKGIVDQFKKRRVWIMLDEWSSVPHELQPFLADLIRRSIFPVNSITVQIAAIEQRCNFVIHGANGEYIGIELGADVSADVNLDDFMVFENDAERAKNFFRQFLYNHFEAVEGRDGRITVRDSSELIRKVFTEIRAFEEFVRAVEGVPRDAINIIGLAALKAGDALISVQIVRNAARDWYQRDKANVLNSKPELNQLLQWIITEVIESRRARAFLLQSDQRDVMIDDLFDARLLHVLKKSVAAHDHPGVRYLVYKLDYGCYVDLLLTAKAPNGLLPGEDDGMYLEVPPDDYRAIRRAILDINAFRGQKMTN